MKYDGGRSRPGYSGAAAKIALKGVFKTFRRHRSGDVEALADFTLDIADQTFFTLLGPSGCGKTTALRLINGLISPDSGTVLVSGRPPHPGREMSFVFQTFRLIPWATVATNVGFTLEISGVPRAERTERVAQYLQLVGLTRFADSYPAELSGGMKQRVALARALVTEPDILLMDEPFASIDAQTRELMQIELMQLWTTRKCVVVFVTHSVDEAVLLSDKIVLMSPRPGRVLEVVNVSLPRPRSEHDVRTRPEFIELRAYLWDRIKALVLSDVNSDFYGRQPGSGE